jgi:alpha-galactosidase
MTMTDLSPHIPSRWLFAFFCTILYAMTVLNPPPGAAQDQVTAIAVRFTGAPDAAGFPASDQWDAAPAYKFDADWQGNNADPQRATTVQLLWTPETLFLRFTAQYRSITVFTDSDPDGRRYQLWDRDVAEVFMQPDSSDPWRYKEFEVSPNGFWVDLDISHGKNENLHSGLRRRVSVNEKTKTWIAELALPMKVLTPRFNPKDSWRVNFFRVEGPAEPRFYSSWRPTHSPQPNFHVPEAFGTLRFE